MDAIAILQRIGRGTVIEDLAEAVVKASEEVVQTGKPATVTLALKVSNKSIGDPFVMVEEQIARSSPKKAPLGAFFYFFDGELHLDDPRQATMAFRAVDRATGEIREPDTVGTVREVGS